MMGLLNTLVLRLRSAPPDSIVVTVQGLLLTLFCSFVLVLWVRF